MESRIKELEEQLHHATQTPGNRHSSQALDSNEKLSVALPGEAFSMYKTRMYGRSHWFNQAILVISSTINGESCLVAGTYR